MRYLILFLFLIISAEIVGQHEAINQFDSSGNRHGKWIVYLGEKWEKTDSSEAVYYRYTWFDHGVNIHPMGRGGSKDSRLETTADPGEKGKIRLLDGKYSWYENGRLKFEHVLKDGEYVSYKEYDKQGNLVSYFDYTTGCGSQPHSWILYTYDKAGNITGKFPICKDQDGNWPKMRG